MSKNRGQTAKKLLPRTGMEGTTMKRSEMIQKLQEYIEIEIQNPDFHTYMGENCLYLMEKAGMTMLSWEDVTTLVKGGMLIENRGIYGWEPECEKIEVIKIDRPGGTRTRQEIGDAIEKVTGRKRK